MQDQILQNILTRIDSVSTESALKDPVRFHPSLQPAVELSQILEDTSSTYGDVLTEDYYERRAAERETGLRSEEHTSELQSRGHLVCCLLLEKNKRKLLYIVLS